ncbi:unnamed protein product [Sympodiomycopsis kandeliae]
MNSCQSIRADLAACVLESDCVTKNDRSGQDCLQNHTNELSDDCLNIYKSYVHCKRGMLDMRKRFRGNAPPTAKSNNPHGATSTVESSISSDTPQSQQ